MSKAPTLRLKLKSLNKHDITDIMYTETDTVMNLTNSQHVMPYTDKFQRN